MFVFVFVLFVFFFKQKTAYELRISDWSSDVCSSDLVVIARVGGCEDCGSRANTECHELWSYDEDLAVQKLAGFRAVCKDCHETYHLGYASVRDRYAVAFQRLVTINRILKHETEEFEEEIFSKFLRRSELERSEEHTSELQSLMRNSYAVFCLKQ